MINREIKRKKEKEKFSKKRESLKKIIADMKKSNEERFNAQLSLQKLPRNSSPVRTQRRCNLTGRPRSVYRKFGLSRNKLREFAMQGYIPGLRKASW